VKSPRVCIQTFSIFQFWALAAESSLTYEKNGEREEFFLVLTLTKHFLHFF